MTRARAVVVASCSAVLLAACSGSGSGSGAKADPTTTEQLVALKAKGIYFGHQSVGYNIMAGVDKLLEAVPAADRLARSGDLARAGAGWWIDGSVGSNTDPISKITAFQANVTAHCAALDLAFVKFCYVDSAWFDGATHTPAALLAAYDAMATALHAACPRVTLVHFTMPLQTSGNAQREQYNDLLRARYGAAVFDVALWESTLPDGSRARDGANVPVLYSGYTSDGGHLNDTGRGAVATRLVALLAGL